MRQCVVISFHADLISTSIIELIRCRLSLSLHLHIDSVSWNARPPNRKHDENAMNGARPSIEGQRGGGRNDKDEKATGKVDCCQRNSPPGGRQSRHAHPKQQQQASFSRGGRGVRASLLGIVTVFLTRRAVFRGGTAFREEEEEEDVRSRPGGDVTESLR